MNHSFFDNIDCEEKAYVLGLIASDGYVHQKDARIQIELNEKDIQILNDIIKVLKTDLKIYKRTRIDKRYPNPLRSVILQFYSRQMVDSLIKLGITQNKSLTLNFPEIDDKLVSHFLRSYMDGDGNLGIYGGVPAFSLYSSRPFCEQVQTILKKKLNVRSGVYDKGRISVLRISNLPDIMKTLDFIYKDATIYLDRKYNAYLLIKELAEQRDLKQLQQRTKICSILHCERKYNCKGLCEKHYNQFNKGKLTPIPI